MYGSSKFISNWLSRDFNNCFNGYAIKNWKRILVRMSLWCRSLIIICLVTLFIYINKTGKVL